MMYHFLTAHNIENGPLLITGMSQCRMLLLSDHPNNVYYIRRRTQNHIQNHGDTHDGPFLSSGPPFIIRMENKSYRELKHH